MDIEQQRLELEKKRLYLEEQKNHEQNKFINQHFGLLITMILSIMTAGVSYVQYETTRMDNNTTLQVENIRKYAELNATKISQERNWKLNVAEFMFNHRALIFSKDVNESTQMRNVMLSTFPSEMTDKVFRKIESIVPESQKLIWIEGQQKLDTIILSKNQAKEDLDITHIQNKITVEQIKQYVSEFKESNRRAISDKIAILYENNKDVVIEGLVQGKLPQTDIWSYRVNIYIARTLEKIKPSWSGTQNQIQKIKDLEKSSNYINDRTFKARVDGAISNIGSIKDSV